MHFIIISAIQIVINCQFVYLTLMIWGEKCLENFYKMHGML